MFHWGLRMKLKFDPTNKCYMHNPISVLENEIHKLLWDFDIQTDHLISARQPDLIIINREKKRTGKIVDFTVPADHIVKLIGNEKKRRISTMTLLGNWENCWTWKWWRCPRGVIVKAMDCGIVGREFILQSRYYVYFRANTLGKGMNPLILSAMG